MFQHTAARRRLHLAKRFASIGGQVSTHSRAKAAANDLNQMPHVITVSTHSRAKAAAKTCDDYGKFSVGFNTQPREGGCIVTKWLFLIYSMFQHTAARRRLQWCLFIRANGRWFQHTAARRRLHLRFAVQFAILAVSTHSRAKAAASGAKYDIANGIVSTHSRAKAAAPLSCSICTKGLAFQHTAARRRLLLQTRQRCGVGGVSTHSRAKAAAF